MPWPEIVTAMDATELATFGESTTYTPGGGAAIPVTGIFSTPYARADVGQAGAETELPSVFYRLADLPVDPTLDDGAAIVARGVTYRVAEAQKDGQGGAKLLLHRAE